MKLPQKIPLDKIIIKHRGFYNHEEFIKAIHNWFGDNDFFFEVEKYKLTGATLKYTFSGDKKVTEYLLWKMKCFMIIYELKDAEIIKEGKKIKTNHARVHIEITATLIIDWQGRFQKKGKFLTLLGDFLRDYILRYKIVDMWADELALKQVELANVIKNALKQEVV